MRQSRDSGLGPSSPHRRIGGAPEPTLNDSTAVHNHIPRSQPHHHQQPRKRRFDAHALSARATCIKARPLTTSHSPHPTRRWRCIFFPHDNRRSIGDVAFAGDERMRVGNDDGRLLIKAALVACVRGRVAVGRVVRGRLAMRLVRGRRRIV